MARTRGVSNFSANYEVKIQGALDARTLVPTKAELLLDTTWENDGLEYTYVGMIVSVWNNGVDNGVYRLTATDYTDVSNWDKLGTSGDISTLSTALSTEVVTRSSADSSLSVSLSSEVSSRSSYDTSLSSALSSEASIRSSADSTLSTTITSAISTEASARVAADSSEASTRSSADSTLSSAISSESAARIAADNTFLVKSNNLSDLTDTASARNNIGLGNVNNTADANKSVNYATTAGSASSSGAASDSALLNGLPGSHYAQPLAAHTNYAGGFFNNRFYVSTTGDLAWYNFTPEWPSVDYVIMGKTILINFSCEWTMPAGWWGALGKKLRIDFTDAGNIQFGNLNWFNVTIVEKDGASPWGVRRKGAFGQRSGLPNQILIEFEAVSDGVYNTFQRSDAYDIYFSGAFPLL